MDSYVITVRCLIWEGFCPLGYVSIRREEGVLRSCVRGGVFVCLWLYPVCPGRKDLLYIHRLLVRCPTNSRRVTGPLPHGGYRWTLFRCLTHVITHLGECRTHSITTSTHICDSHEILATHEGSKHRCGAAYMAAFMRQDRILGAATGSTRDIWRLEPTIWIWPQATSQARNRCATLHALGRSSA